MLIGFRAVCEVVDRFDVAAVVVSRCDCIVAGGIREYLAVFSVLVDAVLGDSGVVGAPAGVALGSGTTVLVPPRELLSRNNGGATAVIAVVVAVVRSAVVVAVL